MKKGILKQEKPHLKLGIMGAVSHGAPSVTSVIEKTLAKHKNREPRTVYDALINSDRNSAKRASVVAKSPDEARRLLEKEHGKGTVFSLSNKHLADKIR